MTNTLRPTSEFMERQIGYHVGVLDHGFLRVVDYMGTSAAVVQAARVSYGTGTKSVREDRGLIRYLLRHRHTTPFEMLELKLHLKMPIFVARQWIRHRMASINEYSGRYSLMSSEFYVPEAEAIQPQSKTNRQGRDGRYSEGDQRVMQEALRIVQKDAYECYQHMVDEDGYNLSRELARIGLSLGTYTEFYWKIDLHNLLHFLSLRVDSHAQMEIRVYAEVIENIIAGWVPEVHGAWVDYVKDACTFSRQEMELLREMVGDDPVGDLETTLRTKWVRDLSGSAREMREFLTKIGVQ
jgi:thymidylate synthase (FAD)